MQPPAPTLPCLSCRPHPNHLSIPPRRRRRPRQTAIPTASSKKSTPMAICAPVKPQRMTDLQSADAFSTQRLRRPTPNHARFSSSHLPGRSSKQKVPRQSLRMESGSLVVSIRYLWTCSAATRGSLGSLTRSQVPRPRGSLPRANPTRLQPRQQNAPLLLARPLPPRPLPRPTQLHANPWGRPQAGLVSLHRLPNRVEHLPEHDERVANTTTPVYKQRGQRNASSYASTDHPSPNYPCYIPNEFTRRN